MGFETPLNVGRAQERNEFETSLWDLKLVLSNQRATMWGSKPPYGIWNLTTSETL